MKNRDLFARDPIAHKLENDGVASVTEATTKNEVQTLRYELDHFVCEGQYEDGLVRILKSYIEHLGSTAQPASWVSGFYGSGKSHLLKMLRHLWVDTRFDSDGATARGLADLPEEVTDLLKELSTLGKRFGGLHAASGTMPSGGNLSVRPIVLGILLRSKGMPDVLPAAKFCLWLQKNGLFEKVKAGVEAAGRDFMSELYDLYASPILAKALLDAHPTFAASLVDVGTLLEAQFPDPEDITTQEFIRLIREILSVDGNIPCTVIVLDEIQLFIGTSDDHRSTDIQEVAEALCKQLDCRVLLIGAGQTALASGTPLLQRLQARFTIPVELSDTDVETVTRRVVLAKKADKTKAVRECLDSNSGEITRQLNGSSIAARSDDRTIEVEDYPLLPARRRFWEHVMRAVDVAGTTSQLRSQLRIVHDAVAEIADEPLGTIVPADFFFDQQQATLLRTGALLRDHDETIRKLDDGTPAGRLARRLCALVYLIRKLSRDAAADIKVRATADMLADLLVSDLTSEGPTLRRDVPRVLGQLVTDGKLIKIDDEYSLQTRESAEWDREFRNRQTKLNSDLIAQGAKRAELLKAACQTAIGKPGLTHGKSKEPRSIALHFGSTAPAPDGSKISIWIRDEWGESNSAVVSDARAAGSESPTIFVWLPKSSAEDLAKAIVDCEAARATLDFKSAPNTPEAREAADAMAGRLRDAERRRDSIIKEVVGAGKVFQGGGSERFDLTFAEKIKTAAEASLDRMFPNFRDADHDRWDGVITRAKNGDEAALEAVGHKDKPERHPVCAAILAKVGAGMRGRELRAAFEESPYGWPRDAVDGGLITLHTTGHLRATHNGVTLPPKQLDQAKISVTEFRSESAPLQVADKIKLRRLFQSAGVPCNSGEEAAAAPQFLAKLVEIGGRAGGDAPLPARPSVAHLDTLRGLGGNDQLASILAQHDTLAKQLKDWSDADSLAAKHKSAWDTLCRLLGHGKELAGIDDFQRQADAVRDGRRLLDATDPVPDLRKRSASLLRTAVTAAHAECKDVFTQEMAALAASANWQKLTDPQRQQILRDAGIAQIPDLAVGDEAALVRTLDEAPLPTWKTRAQALPKQFGNAALAAARLLEPKTQERHLTSGTLKSAEDVQAWLTAAEKELTEALKKGPVVII